MAVLTQDGVAIGFSDSGEGEPVFVFIHEWLAERSVWAQTVDDLERSYRCIAVDLRGCGDSSRQGPGDLSTLADDVADVVLHLELPPVIVVGHGLGGLVAMMLGERHPQLVAGTVLADPWLTVISDGSLAALAASVREEGSVIPVRRFVENLFSPATPREHLDRTRQTLEALPPQQAAETLASAAALEPDLDRLLRDTDRKPFMALWPGSAPMGNPDELRNTTVFLRQEPIAGGSHYFQLEDPVLTTVLLRAFVDDVERDPRLQRHD